MSRLSHSTNRILKLLKEEWFLFLAAAVALIILVAIILIIIVVSGRAGEKDSAIQIEDTPITIEEVRPKGELYVCSSIIEESIRKERTEKHLGIIPEKHTFVQIVRQRCSYTIDLDKIEYIKGEGDTLYVRLPELKYSATTQNTPFISDDEAYWAKEIPNTNVIKGEVCKLIRRRFETDKNKDKAQIYAQEAVAQLLKQFGYTVEFMSTLTDDRK